MITVTVASQKGGCGKSTLSRHGSVILPNAVLLDLDPQGTTKTWLTRRNNNGVSEPKSVLASPQRVADAVRAVAAKGFSWMVVDTPPEHDDQRAIQAAIAVSDYVLIPCKPSPDDMDVIPQTIRLARNAGKPFGIVMTMTRHAKFDDGACKLIETLAGEMGGDFSPVRIANRVAYVESVHYSEAVTEYDPKGKAASEMRELWAWVMERASAHAGRG